MNYWREIQVVVLLLLLVPLAASANLSDTIVLDKVVAKGIKFNSTTIGAKVYTVDSLTLKSYRTGSLCDLLQKQSLLAVKTYGPGGLASVSMRGGSSRHTAVIWNGFNIRSPMSGEMNFSSLPAGFVDEVIIQPGGSSTMYGSGAASGIIYLSNELPLNGSGWQSEINSEVGSFGSVAGFITTGFYGTRFSSRLKIGGQIADNDFVFTNYDKTGHPVDTLKHAACSRRALMHQASFRINSRLIFETDLLYVHYTKEIPAMTFDYAGSNADQNDNDLRFAMNLARFGQHWFLKFRTGILYSHINYNDPDIVPAVSTNNKSISVINEAESKFSFNPHHTIYLGVNQTAEKASSQGYTSEIMQSRFSAFGRYSLSVVRDRINFSFETREELVGGNTIPFVFSFGADVKIIDGLTLKGVVAKHYALPIFDDLYWKEDAYSVGNPALSPEFGWNYETGLAYKVKGTSISVNNELTLFNHHIYDLIIWLPANSTNGYGSKWMPGNMDESKSFGIEFMGDIQINLNRSALEVQYMYSYTDARIFDESKTTGEGYPRIYVPKNNASFTLGYTRSHINLQYIQTYTGSCYYDGYHKLSGYTLADIQINYALAWKGLTIETYLKIMNIYSADYRVMLGYAQPPRNFSLGMNLIF